MIATGHNDRAKLKPIHDVGFDRHFKAAT